MHSPDLPVCTGSGEHQTRGFSYCLQSLLLKQAGCFITWTIWTMAVLSSMNTAESSSALLSTSCSGQSKLGCWGYGIWGMGGVERNNWLFYKHVHASTYYWYRYHYGLPEALNSCLYRLCIGILWLTWEHKNNSQSWIPCLTVFSFSTKNKKTLLQYQGRAEEPLSLQQSLGAQSPDASGTEAKKMCDATSQTTGVVCMIKHTISAGTQ